MKAIDELDVRDELFDPLDPQVINDPYPTYRSLRAKQPVYWHKELNSWILSSYAHCELVLADSDLFAADFRRVGIPTPAPILNLQTLDPPEQTPLRQFAMNAVRAQDLAALEQDTARLAHDLLERLGSQCIFDFVHDFSDPFTLGTICKLLGTEPPERDENWARMNDDLDRSMDSDLALGAEAPGMVARAAFSSLIIKWLSGAPQDGILGYIVRHGKEAGVSDEILVNSVRAFWHAGFEVPSRFLGNAMLALLRHQDAIVHLRSGASIDLVVEELVRFAGPVHAVSRACTRTTDIGGQVIRSGDTVVVLVAAANRDPAQFDNAEELVLGRHPNPHLGFGRGAHACLGAHIARMEARALLRELLRRDIKLVAEPVLRPNATLRGPARMQVALDKPLTLKSAEKAASSSVSLAAGGVCRHFVNEGM